MSRTRMYEWHKKLKSGRDGVVDDPKPGRPTTSRNDKKIQNVNELVHSERRMGRTILTEDLGIKKICTKMVPKLLTLWI